MSETASVSSPPPPPHDSSLINNTPLNCITNVASTQSHSASSPTSTSTPSTLNSQRSNQTPNTPPPANTHTSESRAEEQPETQTQQQRPPTQDGSAAAGATPITASPTSQTASDSAAAAAVTRSRSGSSPSGRAPLKSCLIRLASDLRSLEADPVEGIDASPVDGSNLLYWRAAVFGPADTEWEGGIFQLNLNFPPDYPQKPPHVMFSTKIYHPNVFSDGTLCLDIIQDKWSPVYTVSTILTSVQSLLADPNTSSPANSEAARLFATDKKEYRKRVRACVAKCTSL